MDVPMPSFYGLGEVALPDPGDFDDEDDDPPPAPPPPPAQDAVVTVTVSGRASFAGPLAGCSLAILSAALDEVATDDENVPPEVYTVTAADGTFEASYVLPAALASLFASESFGVTLSSDQEDPGDCVDQFTGKTIDVFLAGVGKPQVSIPSDSSSAPASSSLGEYSALVENSTIEEAAMVHTPATLVAALVELEGAGVDEAVAAAHGFLGLAPPSPAVPAVNTYDFLPLAQAGSASALDLAATAAQMNVVLSLGAGYIDGAIDGIGRDSAAIKVHAAMAAEARSAHHPTPGPAPFNFTSKEAIQTLLLAAYEYEPPEDDDDDDDGDDDDDVASNAPNMEPDGPSSGGEGEEEGDGPGEGDGYGEGEGGSGEGASRRLQQLPAGLEAALAAVSEVTANVNGHIEQAVTAGAAGGDASAAMAGIIQSAIAVAEDVAPSVQALAGGTQTPDDLTTAVTAESFAATAQAKAVPASAEASLGTLQAQAPPITDDVADDVAPASGDVAPPASTYGGDDSKGGMSTTNLVIVCAVGVVSIGLVIFMVVYSKQKKKQMVGGGLFNDDVVRLGTNRAPFDMMAAMAGGAGGCVGGMGGMGGGVRERGGSYGTSYNPAYEESP